MLLEMSANSGAIFLAFSISFFAAARLKHPSTSPHGFPFQMILSGPLSSSISSLKPIIDRMVPAMAVLMGSLLTLSRPEPWAAFRRPN